jgi:tetratricopeptide (TPR) repeat protein
MHEARQLAEEAGEHGLAASCLVQSGLYQCFISDIRVGLATMERGLRELDGLSDTEREQLASSHDPAEIEFAAGSLVLWLAHSGQLQEALALGERRIVAVPSPSLRPGRPGSPYADGWLGLATAYAMLGQSKLAQQAIIRARSLYQAIDHHALTAGTYLVDLARIQLPYATDQPTEQLHRLAVEGEEAFQRASGVNPLGMHAQSVALPLLLLQGNWDDAKAAAIQTHTSGLRTIFWFTACETLALLTAAQGNAALANRIIDDLLPGGPETEPGNSMLWIALILQRLAAHLALEVGDLSTARAWLDAHDRWLKWSGAVLGLAEGALGWAEYRHANGESSQSRTAAEQALSYASDPRQLLALIAIHRFLGQLDTEAANFATADEHLSESLRLAEACAAPFERALTLLEIAKLRATQGRIDEAKTLVSEVRVVCEPLEAKPTLARVAALEQQLVRTEADDA